MLALPFITACRKQICMEENHPHYRSFRVIVDRAYMGDAHPQVRIDFYSDEGEHYTRYVYAGEETVKLPVGHYRLVAFNDDSDLYTIQDDAFCEAIKARMPEISRSQYNNLYGGRIMAPSGEPDSDDPQDNQGSVKSVVPASTTHTIGQPDDLFVYSLPDFDVTVDGQMQQDLYLLPRNRTVSYLILTDIQGLQYAQQIRGTMTGTAGAKFLYDQVRDSQVFTTMFDCAKNSSSSLTAVVAAFGINKVAPAVRTENDTNIITFEFLLTDNTVYRQSFDIYDYLDEELCCDGGIIDLRRVPIIIPATESTGGWNAELADWYEQTVELE